MKTILFIFVVPLTILSVAAVAHSETGQLQLGQNASMKSGDVLVVKSGNKASAITCGDGGTIQPPRDYPGEETADMMDDHNRPDEESARIRCSLGRDFNVRLLEDSLLKKAMNECMRQNQNCYKFGETEYKFIRKGLLFNHHMCRVSILVRGQQ